MERQLWPRLYRAVMAVANGARPCRAQFGDAAVVLTQVWAVLHDRPTCWACDADNWATADEDQRPFLDAPPSPSTMSRRLRALGVRQLLARVQQAVADQFPRAMCCWMDPRRCRWAGPAVTPTPRSAAALAFALKAIACTCCTTRAARSSRGCWRR